MIDDLTSRGALSGAASLVLLVGVVVGWWAWTTRILKERRETPIRILVTGSRGKSSTVRLLHAALAEGGYRPYGKVTGTAAAEITTDGTEVGTFRLGAPSVLETFDTMRRAFRADPRADSLTFECMAISPALIELLADRMVDPGIVVITNVKLDHLEEEGTTLAEIAASLGGAIRPGSLVVTGESDPEALGALERQAEERAAELVICRTGDLPADSLERLPLIHPQNVGLTLAVTRSLGIADYTAIAGMAGASREPGDQEVWRRQMAGLDATWSDLGAVNDPESLGQALDGLDLPVAAGAPRIGMVFGRWDRPLRALEFAGFLLPGRFDGVMVAGGPVRPVREALVAAGWDTDRVVVSPGAAALGPSWEHELAALVERVAPGARQVALVSLENEHDGLADRVRDFFHGGSRIDGGFNGGIGVVGGA